MGKSPIVKKLCKIVIYTISLQSAIFPYNSLYTQAVVYTTYFELGEPVFNSAFAVSFQRGATLESGLRVARFFSTNHDSLLRMATNEIASF